MERIPKLHIGDGVYAEYDGYQIILSTSRDNGIHYICLDDTVLHGLELYKKRIIEALKEAKNEHNHI